MLHHIVMFKLVESALPADHDLVLESLRSLPSQIPDVVSFDCGFVVGPAKERWDVVLSATFADWEAYQRYTSSLPHVNVATDVLRPKMQEISGVQFESAEVPAA